MLYPSGRRVPPIQRGSGAVLSIVSAVWHTHSTLSSSLLAWQSRPPASVVARAIDPSCGWSPAQVRTLALRPISPAWEPHLWRLASGASLSSSVSWSLRLSLILVFWSFGLLVSFSSCATSSLPSVRPRCCEPPAVICAGPPPPRIARLLTASLSHLCGSSHRHRHDPTASLLHASPSPPATLTRTVVVLPSARAVRREGRREGAALRTRLTLRSARR